MGSYKVTVKRRREDKRWPSSIISEMHEDTLELLVYHIAVEFQRRMVPGADRLLLAISAVHCARIVPPLTRERAKP